MAKRLQHRGGTTAQHSTFTGAVREVTVDTTKNTLVVHDGATAGGHPLATATNFTSTGIDDNATSTAITIDSSQNVTVDGNVVIQKATGDVSLTIQANENLSSREPSLNLIGYNTSSNPTINFGDNAGYAGAIEYENSDNSMRLYTATSESMRITSAGNVGIGTTNPIGLVNIVQASNTQALLRLRNNTADTSAADGMIFTITDSSSPVGSIEMISGGSDAVLAFRTNGSEHMRILSNGRISINRTGHNGAAQLDILHPGSSEYGLTLDSSNTSGTQYHLDIRRGGVQAGYLVSQTATTVALANASDERLKENIQNSNSAIEDLKNIQVRQFDWKDGIDTHKDFGFVAQELINVVPEAVTQGTDELDENGKPVRTWGIDYSHIVPRLVKVCQEQQTKIEELEAKITALETQP